jgi:hypothetical protein
MNLFLQPLNGDVDAKQTVALLCVWGVQINVIVGIALITKAQESTGRSDT